MREDPEREPWPLCPRVEVLPIPEPIPRPMRFLFSFAFLGARRLERLRIAIVFPRYNAAEVFSDSHDLVKPGLKPLCLYGFVGGCPHAESKLLDVRDYST